MSEPRTPSLDTKTGEAAKADRQPNTVAVTLARIAAYRAVATTAARAAGLVGVAWCLKGSIDALAGRSTTLNALVNGLVDLRMSEWAAWALATVMLLAYRRERTLRKRVTADLSQHTEKLEKARRSRPGVQRIDARRRAAEKQAGQSMTFDLHLFGIVFRFFLCVVAMYGAWRLMIVPTLNDEYRHAMFNVRRSLLALVAEGELENTDPAYRNAWKILNAFLYRGEDFSLAALLWASARGPRSATIVMSPLTDRVIAPAFALLVKRAVFTSIPGMIVITLAFVVHYLKTHGEHVRTVKGVVLDKLISRQAVLDQAVRLA